MGTGKSSNTGKGMKFHACDDLSLGETPWAEVAMSIR